MITTDWARGLSWQPGFDQAGADLAVLASNVEQAVGDGTPFFDHLDEALRSDRWFMPLRMFYEMRDNKVLHGPFGGRPIQYPDLALTGTFGRRFARHMQKHETFNTYVFPGNLRHEDLPPIPLDLTGHRFVFMDDSYYRGRTYQKIKSRIEQAGGEMLWAMVLYDGSREPPVIPSFFRFHPLEGYRP